jgi:hypothetical protein
VTDEQEVFVAEYNQRLDEYFYSACQHEPEHPWDYHADNLSFVLETCQDGRCRNSEWFPDDHEEWRDLFLCSSRSKSLNKNELQTCENLTCDFFVTNDGYFQTPSSGSQASYGQELCLMLLMIAVSTQMILLPVWTIALLIWTFSTLAADLMVPPPAANDTLPSIVFIVVKPIVE